MGFFACDWDRRGGFEDISMYILIDYDYNYDHCT